MKTIRISLTLLLALAIASCNTTQKNQKEDISDDYAITDIVPIEEYPAVPQITEECDMAILESTPHLLELKKIEVQGNSSTMKVRMGPAAYRDQIPNTEQYSSFAENRFMMAADQPLSTFSVDVDAASYSNMRRFINQGQLPPSESLRVEEMINYFSYNYAQPKGDDPVNILTEVGACPWNEQHRLVRIGIKAKEIDSKKLPASNFVFLIDVSGSMSGGNRIGLVKSSLKLLLNNLREEDKVSIVTYAGSAQTVLTPTSGADKQKIRETIENLQVGGWTNGGDGMKLAYDVARQNFVKDGNNRIIMCSDGDFNVGDQTEDQLERLVEKERQSGVFLSVLGYGMGNYKDNKMQVLAQKGNGNHAYIDNLQEANKVLVNEFGATMYTVAKDVKLQIEFNPTKVQAYRLVGYETRLLNKEDFNNDAIDAGEIGAGHTVTAFYEVVPIGVKSNLVDSTDPLKYQNVDTKKNALASSSPDLLTVKLRYKQPTGDVSKLMEQALIDNDRTDRTSADFRFASSVAMFAQVLKSSVYKGDGSYDKVLTLAQSALDNDKYGYKREFVRLVETTKGLAR